MGVTYLSKISIVLVFLLASITNVGAQDDQRIADSLADKVTYHLVRDNFDSALAVTNLLYQTNSRLGDFEEMVRAKVHRAELLRDMQSLDLAYEALQEVEALNETLEPSTVKSYYFNRLAAIQYERKKSDSAIIAIRRSQKIDSLKGYRWRVFSNLNLLGAIYRDREQWDKAVSILENTYRKAKEFEDTAEMNSAIKNLATALYRMGDFRGAIAAGIKYTKTPWAFYDRKSVSDNFRIIASAYEELGQFDSAYYALDSAHQQTLEGLQVMVDRRIDNYKVANELEKQKLENSVLITEKQNSQLQSLMLVIILLSIISLAIVLFRQKQNYKKLNEKQQELNSELEGSLAFKNQLIGIVAHDIRNPMASLTGVLHLYNEGLIEDADLKDMMGKLEASAVSVNFLIENLLTWVLNQKKALVAKKADFDLNTLVQKTYQELESQYKAKRITIKQEGLKENLEINSDEVMLGLVIRNILSNAIKFSHENSEIVISYLPEESAHLISIKDFGIGMDKQSLEMVEMGIAKTQKGTKNEKGTGLGMELSREFLTAIQGSFKITSKKGEGTEVVLSIPK